MIESGKVIDVGVAFMDGVFCGGHLKWGWDFCFCIIANNEWMWMFLTGS